MELLCLAEHYAVMILVLEMFVNAFPLCRGLKTLTRVFADQLDVFLSRIK
jgi:hypothetical protein